MAPRMSLRIVWFVAGAATAATFFAKSIAGRDGSGVVLIQTASASITEFECTTLPVSTWHAIPPSELCTEDNESKSKSVCRSMKNRWLIDCNSTNTSEDAGPLKVMFDGKKASNQRDENGNDKFEKPSLLSGTRQILVLAWKSGVPEGPGSDDLIKLASPEMVASALRVAKLPALKIVHGEMIRSLCKDALALLVAKKTCAQIRHTYPRASCIADSCLAGKVSVVDGVTVAGVLRERLSFGQVPLFVGDGQCRDVNGQAFRVVRMKGVQSEQECRHSLRQLAAQVSGIVGAQCHTEGTCELLVRSGTDLPDFLGFVPMGGGWIEADMRSAQEGPKADYLGAAGRVVGIEKDLSWKCWRWG
mmetsp:Transcript_112667/g.358034  ORF Transcript_112667/g.358034 Transcript_112667/m.358034 type:complete len:360 (+) Transcript_112667:281-1360(+)